MLALLGLLFAVPSVSGAPYLTWVSTDPPTLIKHLRTDLQSRESSKREAALIDVIALANCTSTCTIALRSVDEKRIRIENASGKGAVVDLSVLVPDLIETYRTGPADGHRLLALSALIHVGNEKALEQLIGESARQSDRVERATHRTLVAHYLSRYPELEETVTRARTLSIEEVWRAEALRVKAAKRGGQN
jgi:hypothetical protein